MSVGRGEVGVYESRGRSCQHMKSPVIGTAGFAGIVRLLPALVEIES